MKLGIITHVAFMIYVFLRDYYYGYLSWADHLHLYVFRLTAFHSYTLPRSLIKPTIEKFCYGFYTILETSRWIIYNQPVNIIVEKLTT